MVTKLTYSRARPVRVAFLIEKNEHAEITLDAIFKRCFGFWGGRFSLIVPCEAGRPKPAYNAWLEKFDPDIIYSYIDLENSVVDHIHEWLYPSFLVRHKTFREKIDAHTLHPRLPTDPLKVSTLLPIAAGPALFEAAQPTRVIDSMGSVSDDRFLQDNFGSWTGSLGTSFPGYLRQYAHVLYVVADDEAQPRERYIRPPDETINSPLAVLNAFSDGRVAPAALLSAMFAPRLELDRSPLGVAFNIVAGDTYEDRLLYWNARSHFPKWQDSGSVDLRVPTAFLENASAIELIGNFLKVRNRIMGNQGGTPLAMVRSSSISEDKLKAFAAELKKYHTWASFRVEKFESADTCVPAPEKLAHSSFLASDSSLFRASSVWNETPFQDNEIKISPPAPDHLRYSSTALLSPHEGQWAVDLDIDRQLNYSQHSNVRQKWRLPRRLRMTSSFVAWYELQSPGQLMVPRVSAPGLLTLYANTGSKFPTISEPDDFAAFKKSFLRGKDWYQFDGGPDRPLVQLCQGFERSENGRYFWGVLQMFGDLNDANEILLSKFWQRQFERLGASSAQSELRRDEVERTLKKRFRSRTLDFGKDSDLTRLTNIVLQQAEHYRSHIPALSWDELAKAFTESQNREWQRNPPPEAIPDNELAEMRDHELRSFTSQVKWLSRIGILHQGYEHKCKKCLHRSWIGIDNVQRELKCEVCSIAEAAPVSQPWRFRLNEFLREALRKHGILPIFWTLSELRHFREEWFYFEGPSDIWFDTDAEGPDSDLDLVCVSNGIVFICEIKQSARQLRKAKDFSTTIRRLRPDVGVIAVMEPLSARASESFNEFKENLQGSGIETKLISLKDQNESD